jgi:hypothetical protein
MKRMLLNLLKLAAYPTPLRPVLARKVIKHLSFLPYEDRLALAAVERPHYGYCIFQAAKLASLLGYPRISAIEFGCGGGNGLVNAETHIAEVKKIFGVEIELYGFDMGSGLPRPTDYRDMPYYFQPGLYKMDRTSLEREIKHAKLVIGDVRDTCATFFDKYDPAPIGCMFQDLDFYSSTSAALSLFSADASHFLPRIFMNFDDIIGDNEFWLCTDYTGERLAIEEFNRNHQSKKISKEYSLPLRYPDQWWPHHVYIYHDFGHPRYNEYVGAEAQTSHEYSIKLR